MVRKNINQDNDILDLEYFGTRGINREKISIPIDEQNITPGAAAACLTHNIIYIPNIEEYPEHFNLDKSYRSIISIPLNNNGKDTEYVINVDSERKNQFVSTDFISAYIEPRIKILTGLFMLAKIN